MLIDKGTNLSDTDEDGRNALSFLCAYSKNPKILQVARLLISKGIDIQQKDKYGKTAVDYMNERSADKVPDKLQILDLLQSSE